MDDKRIIELFFARDEEALRRTEQKYGRLCYTIAYNVLNDEADSAECTSDTYLQLWNTIPPQRPNNLKAYVCKIARNVSLKKYEYNSAKKRNSSCTVSLHELEEVLPDRHLREETDDEGLGKLINEFLRGEKESARNVFIRRYYFYDEVAAIARKYSFSESKVKSMLFHTRNRLRKFLTARGVYL